MKGETLKERPVGSSLLLSGHMLTCKFVFVSAEAPGDFLTYSGTSQAAFPCVSEFVFLWFWRWFADVFQCVVDDVVLGI